MTGHENTGSANTRTQNTGDKAAAQPVAPAGAQPGPAGYVVAMIRPHMRDIPQCPLPEGYSFRAMSMNDANLWADIWRDAEPYFAIADDLFAKELGHDLPAIARRCFLLLNERRIAVGTISAWYNREFRGLEYGQIHWVAIRPAFQGRGLARGMMTHAMNALAQWHPRALLETQSKRLGAIKLYLDFGFEPDLAPPGAVDVWRGIRAQLDHPALRRL